MQLDVDFLKSFRKVSTATLPRTVAQFRPQRSVALGAMKQLI